MQKEIDTFRYNGETYNVIFDDTINSEDHCKYCQFTKYCEEYINKEEWFACGCTFKAEKYYIKKHG